MRYALASMILAAAFLFPLASQGAVTAIALYPLGEAGSLGAANVPIDTVGGHSYTGNNGAASIIASTVPNSTSALNFVPNQGYYNTGAWSPPTDNFGVEMWVRAANTTQIVDLYEGNAKNNSSLKIGQNGANWVMSLHNVAFIGPSGGVTNSAVAGKWMHIAAVRSSGVFSMYINGALQAGTTAAAASIVPGSMHLAVETQGVTGWSGAMDDLRMFTFTAGSFNPNDMLYAQPTGTLANRGFEPDVASFKPQSWKSTGNLTVSSSEGESEGVNSLVFNGGDSTPNGVLSQAFNTIAGRTYTVTFDFGKFGPGGGTAALNALAFDTMLGVGSPLTSVTVSDTTGVNADSPTVLSSQTFSFIAAGVSTTLQFTDTSSGTASFDTVLDNITLQLNDLPEPGSLTLAGLAALGLACVKRRRRSLQA